MGIAQSISLSIITQMLWIGHYLKPAWLIVWLAFLVLCVADGPPPFDVPPGRQIIRKVKALTPAVAGKAV